MWKLLRKGYTHQQSNDFLNSTRAYRLIALEYLDQNFPQSKYQCMTVLEYGLEDDDNENRWKAFQIAKKLWNDAILPRETLERYMDVCLMSVSFLNMSTGLFDWNRSALPTQFTTSRDRMSFFEVAWWNYFWSRHGVCWCAWLFVISYFYFCIFHKHVKTKESKMICREKVFEMLWIGKNYREDTDPANRFDMHSAQ